MLGFQPISSAPISALLPTIVNPSETEAIWLAPYQDKTWSAPLHKTTWTCACVSTVWKKPRRPIL